MTAHTREEIIAAIQQATAHEGGQPVGYRRFETLTGITRGAWYGVYWTKWADALSEAGLEPNQANQAADKEAVLQLIAELVRRMGRLPTEGDLRIARRSDATLPSMRMLRSFGGRNDLRARLRELATANPAYADLLELVPAPVSPADDDCDREPELPAAPCVTGQVYLAQMGKHYKIGRTNSSGRRMYELAIQLPERLTIIHVLETDDPAGIERYWHERFKGKRGNGEWFLLSREDVAAFKRRGRFM
ncbi:GIY-YIG nuclease family protein [Mycobacterium pseudokansasii]|uniref:GIY-YIG nuclease family protein n=1 Tax=Mycobacterium pseudokansasii TaxID=2341080 RepID=UPI0007B53037|nr:GIY-YIG nuclease family protein [Mycobacterium pseudokansasii]KZS61228.1 hypothetical protein A4G27_24360 [Mycobacterium kansasii]VAZ93353.1 hypothetical protein LAUMK35_02279 [Mycobacterium pseudokansasii]VAZ94362.1 hypothetical protein LAUMK21_02279 [Mycobacterium pseudokansasii]